MEIITKKENTLKSKDILLRSIAKVLKEEKLNMKLQKKLNEMFMEKKIDNSTVYALFRGDMMLEQIERDNIRLICLTEGLYELLENNKKYFVVGDYFTDSEILNYKLYQPQKEEVITTLNLKNVIRINKYEYVTYMSLEYLSKLRKSGLPKYNGNIQRPLKTIINSKGEVTQRISIDKENLKDLTNRFLGVDSNGNPLKDESKDLVTTDIYFFTILEDGKEPLFNWNGDDKPGSIGTLDITPIFDPTSENYAPFIITDGFHRETAGCNAFDIMESKGKYLDKGFMVHLVLANIDRAKHFIGDTFKRTDIQKEQKEAITKTPLTDGLNTLISNCNILKNNVSNTFYDYKALKTSTYKTVLIEALKNTDIDFTKVYKTDSKMKKIAKIINNIFEYYKENDIEEESLYLSGMFVGYIAVANTLLNINDNIDLDLISIVSDKIVEMGKNNIFDDYNLDKKNVKVKDLYKLLETVTMEVVNNAKN